MTATIAEFKAIPGFSKYSTNGKVVKNVSTNKIQSVKSGTNKFQLFHDKGTRNTLTLEQIIALMPVNEAKIKTVQPIKENRIKDLKPKKATKDDLICVPSISELPTSANEMKETLMQREDVARVVNEDFFKGHEKIYRLNKMGLTNKEIQVVLGKRAEVVSRDLWLYSKGKLVFNG